MSVAVRTVKKLKDGVAGLLTGVSLDNVSDLYGKFEEALATLQQKATIPEASTSQIVTLYDGVLNYLAVSPIFGSTIKDIRPVGQNRLSGDNAYRVGGEDFDLAKNYSPVSGYKVTFETENGVNVMRIKTRFTSPRAVIDPVSNTSGWTTGGLLTSLTKDSSFYYSSPASLRFSISGVGSGYIEKTINSIDLTSYQNIGKFFIPIELPTLNLSSIELRIGSDASNYYSITATQGQLGTWTAGDFLDTPFDLASASTTGSPNIASIKYVRITFTASAAISNMRVGYIFVSLPSQHKIFFTTNGVFQSGGVISNFITNDDDIILLSDAPYNIFKHECAMAVGLGEGGTLANGVISTINAKLNGARARNGQVIQLGLYDKYRADNPSEDIRVTGNWYD